MSNNDNSFKISDISRNTTLTIEATLDGGKAELPAKYANITDAELKEVRSKYGDKVLPLDNLVQQWDEKVIEISFKGHLSELQLIAIEDDEVYLWSKIKVLKVKLSTGTQIHLLVANTLKGLKYNRRKGVRVNLDKRMFVEQDGESFDVIVSDLSYCGVGIMEKKESKIKKGVPFVLSLTETEGEEEKLVCKIVAKKINEREPSKGIIVSGCVISSQNADFLQRYVAMKQLEQLNGKKQQFSIQRVASGDEFRTKMAEVFEEASGESEE